MKGQVQGKSLLVGNQALLDSAGIPADVLTEDAKRLAAEGKTPMLWPLRARQRG